MPIFTDVLSFSRYEPRAIQPTLLAALRASQPHASFNATLLRLECYLQVTRQTLELEELNTATGQSKLEHFVGALYSNRFESAHKSLRTVKASQLRIALQSMGAAKDAAAMGKLTSKWHSNGDLAILISDFETSELDMDRVSMWRGWPTENRAARLYHYELHGINERLGKTFADDLHNAIRDWQHGQMASLRLANSFSVYISQIPTEPIFTEPRALSDIIRGFLFAEIAGSHKRGLSICSSTTSVRQFTVFLESHVFGKIWAEPNPRIPKPAVKRINGSRARIKKTSEGLEIKSSLITELPLHLTDTEAMERIFGSIQKDVELIVRWAKAEHRELLARVDRRKSQAQLGVVSHIGKTNAPSGIRYRTSRVCPDYFAHAAATYEARGFSHISDRHGAGFRIYPRPLEDITWQLGIPTAGLLLALAALLVEAHPSLTSSLLRNLELFDQDCKVVGFVEIDGGSYLVGEKLRCGPDLAQKKVLLTPETARVVSDIIELTTPLRNYLRSIHDDSWRNLFISTSSICSKPRAWRPDQVAVDNATWMASRLEQLLGLTSEEATSLAQRFSLTRLRKSAAVLVYMKTQSVQRMAESLGHKNWKPSLLDHYLPPAIQEFFVQRWIRLFQTGIICEALKESPLLLRASSFQSMAELDEFLRNHGFRHIPAHLENPDLPNLTPDNGVDERIIFGIDTGILTLLISLQMAVEAAIRVAGVRASRWARISKHLTSYLEHQRERPEFREMISVARIHADPAKMAAFVHE